MTTRPKAQKRPIAARQQAKAIDRWEGEGGAAMPKRPKQPADVIGNADRAMQIAPGEAEEEYESDPKPEKNAQSDAQPAALK